METGIHLNGNGQAPVQKYWDELLVLIQQGKICPCDMVTHRFDLDDMEKVYDLLTVVHTACKRFSSRRGFQRPDILNHPP